ncbi:transglutaminase domain-containing protein [Mesoterricola sediminis]|uniref:Transglutaminase-like domain-containing protein n=1 Tax=Mesoterricola sediminis TaxID=2927980 RepID=A0AA48KFM1_9BACT|nr:transglutaminase domain-containing protein [Mesoterricola sediminis]BDU76598.1 hypothetical protein METESE_15560 [Mesoterricola sediminis]
MAAVPRPLPILALTALLVPAWTAQAPREDVRAYRSWIAGEEAGGTDKRAWSGPEGRIIEVRDWIRISRLGVDITQDQTTRAVRRHDGALSFTFELRLSQEPLKGTATWTPAKPLRLVVAFQGMPPREVDLPEGTVLWPGDEDDALKTAARERRPVHLKGYSIATQQPTALDLEPVGPDPLPGFPDALRYRGKAQDGPMAQDVEVWISPREAEVRQSGTFGGIPLLVQRASLPAPAAGAPAEGFFARTLKRVPPHPFLPWLDTVDVAWSGATPPDLPEGGLQTRLGPGRWRLRRAPEPAGPARAERPVTGAPSAEDAPYLEATPLVQFRDPAVAALVRRLGAPAGATRWELAQRVSAFVYDWIQDKDYSVGFASAQEVARHPRGDCTEHGVLAVALLRALGVPARGAVGWIAMEGTLGLHFWAEVKVGGDWVPIDPTFDMAPASAFRLRLGTSALADLGSVGWDNASAAFQDGAWLPVSGWGDEVRIQGDTVFAPGLALRAQGPRWALKDGSLTLDGHPAAAAPRPGPAAGARLLQGSNGRKGWFADGLLYADCGGGRWLRIAGLDQAGALRLLDALETRPR